VEGENSRTVYSFICDLKNGNVTIYNYYDYTKSLKFNLEEEIAKGQHEYYLGQLFVDRNMNYEKFIEEGPGKMIEKGYTNNNSVALMFYGILKAHYPKAFKKDIGINVLSQFGMDLVKNNKLEDGMIFLERNTIEFPDSARSHFELANVCLKNNNKEKAIAEYKKTLDINPNHEQANQALENLLLQVE
jgi:tetratricopeptide (TPR) repeat protein